MLKNVMKKRSKRTSTEPFTEEERRLLWESLPELVARSNSLARLQISGPFLSTVRINCPMQCTAYSLSVPDYRLLLDEG